MTKDEVLQKVNDFCTEKQYTTATLTETFKDKFADHFQKANPDGDINDENVIKSLQFALVTAFSSASELATVKTTEFASKENEYKSQIDELKKKVKAPKPQVEPTIPKEVQDQLDELKRYKDEQSKTTKRKSIFEMAKKGVRDDLHSMFDKFYSDFEPKLDKDDKEQADALVARFQDVFKEKIGSVKPLQPQFDAKQDEELIGGLPKVKI